MRGRWMWLVGASALLGCGEGARDAGSPASTSFDGASFEAASFDGPDAASLHAATVAAAVAPVAPVAPDGALAREEACEASCRWGCRAGRCEDAAWTAVGGAHSCALRESGRVDCWGANDRGQLGDGTARARSRAVPVAGVDGAIAIDAGSDHTCVVERTGVTCWGANDRGQLGDGTTRDRATPVGLALDAEIVEVAAGGARSCALTSEGNVLCWGEGVSAPQRIEGVAPAVAIDVGGGHACAVREDGQVWCWGANGEGQLGDGTRERRAAAVRAGALEGIRRVHAGRAHTCAIDAGANAVCWGDNARGQLGDGTLEDRLTPSVAHASVVAVGGDRTCGRVPFGDIACWGAGYGAHGALVPLLDEATVIAIGDGHGCAAHRIGTARCWGENEAGQLGTGTRESSTEPVDALPPSS